MTIPYRTRRACKRIFSVLLSLTLVAVFILLCWLLWLDRFLVYTHEGVKLDFSQSNKLMSGLLQEDTQPQPTVPIHFGDGDEMQQGALTQLNGFYITEDDLSAATASRTPKEDSAAKIAQLIEKVKKLPAGTPVLLEVKNSKGRFFYSSTVSSHRSSLIDSEAADQLIAAIKVQNCYLIAKLPAFRDYYFGLNHVPLGLHHSSGRYLWQDEGGCYWLDPRQQGALTYLVQIINELKSKGFCEVVFSDFRIPDTNNILFSGDRAEAIASAANTIVTACATDAFCVSFAADTAFTLPEGRTRLYLEGVNAADCAATAEQAGLAETVERLVFLTASRDTRFESYGVIRPIE